MEGNKNWLLSVLLGHSVVPNEERLTHVHRWHIQGKFKKKKFNLFDAILATFSSISMRTHELLLIIWCFWCPSWCYYYSCGISYFLWSLQLKVCLLLCCCEAPFDCAEVANVKVVSSCYCFLLSNYGCPAVVAMHDLFCFRLTRSLTARLSSFKLTKRASHQFLSSLLSFQRRCCSGLSTMIIEFVILLWRKCGRHM